jgi:hypothetical protein
LKLEIALFYESAAPFTSVDDPYGKKILYILDFSRVKVIFPPGWHSDGESAKRTP